MLVSKKIYSLLLGFTLISSVSVFAQNTLTPAEKEAAYTKVINQRADKIVANLGIAKESKALKVRDIIARQYRDLNNIHESRDTKIKAAKAEAGATKEAIDARVKSLEEEANTQLNTLHAQYLAHLSKELTSEQVEKVKDGMTYGVLPITYKGYQEMLPGLTEEQKAQIKAWLVEAREHAMDAESSEKKHAWFGKYKGRINNYLSAAGIDMRKAGEEWQKRIKAEAAAKTSNTN